MQQSNGDCSLVQVARVLMHELALVLLLNTFFYLVFLISWFLKALWPGIYQWVLEQSPGFQFGITAAPSVKDSYSDTR